VAGAFRYWTAIRHRVLQRDRALDRGGSRSHRHPVPAAAREGHPSLKVIPTRRNFRTGAQNASLACELRRTSRTARELLDLDDHLTPRFLRSIEHKDLPRHITRRHNRRKLLVDTRGIVFPRSLTGEDHGLVRWADPSDEKESLLSLRGLYRFGMPWAMGAHHDAQYPGGRRLEEEPFLCARQGPILATGTHVNIYPNDVVLGHKKG
jgi:hypothetical protein